MPLEPKKLRYWTEEEVEVWIRDLLDSIKTMDEDMVKGWVRDVWPDETEVYG